MHCADIISIDLANQFVMVAKEGHGRVGTKETLFARRR